jgi:hypothetical protein
MKACTPSFRVLLSVVGCVALGGCVSESQEQVLRSWNRLSSEVNRRRATNPVKAASVTESLGQPDCTVSGARLSTAVPDRKIRDWMIAESAWMLRGLTPLDPLPDDARKEILDCTFWFYDESKRYAFPAEPASFFGMGTGFHLDWFVVKSNGDVVVSSGRGFRHSPLIPSATSRPTGS